MPEQRETIIIVGCGVFGLSTALHLTSTPECRSKYNVIALDAYAIPSPLSAATDYNKIIRAEYADLFYSKLSVEAMKSWEEDPLFSKEFVQCGRFTLTPNDKGNQHRAKYEKQGLDNLKTLGYDVGGIKKVQSGRELGEIVPQFSDNKFGNINGTYNPKAGYGRARRSLEAVYNQCLQQGVTFKFQENGEVTKLLKSKDGKGSVIVKSGKVYNADKILVCSGAMTGKLVDLSSQVKTLGLFVTHIQLTPEQYERYKDIPIFFSSELGYFFPPDSETKKIKIALTYSDVSFKTTDPFNASKSILLPLYKTHNPAHTILPQDVPKVRKVINAVMPELANHKLFDSKLCWISDTPKSEFLIDRVPDFQNVYTATGDAGHAYKFLPNVGKYIMDLIIKGQWSDEELTRKWGWKFGEAAKFPEQFETRAKRFHIDLSEVKEWVVEEKMKSKL